MKTYNVTLSEGQILSVANTLVARVSNESERLDNLPLDNPFAREAADALRMAIKADIEFLTALNRAVEVAR